MLTYLINQIKEIIIDYLFKKSTRRKNSKLKILLVISALEFDSCHAKKFFRVYQKSFTNVP